MSKSIKPKKKIGTIDNKLIIWIGAALVLFVLAVVLVFVIVNASTNYMFKVNKAKVYNHEYNYFLTQAIADEYQEYYDDYKTQYVEDNFEDGTEYDDLSEDQQDEIFKSFFTSVRKSKIEQNAIDLAVNFKGKYKLACEAGYGLSKEEKVNVRSNIDYYYAMYVNYYGYTDAQAVYVLTQGTMNLDQYKEFMIEQTAIDKYKTALEANYTVDEEQLREVYDENPDEYKSVEGRVFQFSLPTAPTAPVDDEGNAIDPATEDPDEQAKQTAYIKELADYYTKLENIANLADSIAAELEANGTYKWVNYDYLTMEEIVEESEGGEEAEEATAVDFETLCTNNSAWSSASTNKGVVTYSADSSTNVTAIDNYLKLIEWDDSRETFVIPVGEGEEPVDTYAKYKVIKVTTKSGEVDVLSSLYIVAVEDVIDFDTPVEEGDEDGLNDIQAEIKVTVLDEMSDAELDEKVANDSRFVASHKREDAMAELFNTLIGE